MFLRASPHPRREPVRAPRLSSTIAHELVHEWLRLDGPAEEVTWFVEGAADYYSLLLRFRAGRIDQDTFLGEVNIAARMADASPLHRLSLDQASRLDRSDFRAHRLPYERRMFYLADLVARLNEATPRRTSVDDVVRHLSKARRAGTYIGPNEWCAYVGQGALVVARVSIRSGHVRVHPRLVGAEARGSHDRVHAGAGDVREPCTKRIVDPQARRDVLDRGHSR